jgi:Domain of unknown function (DUF4919)
VKSFGAAAVRAALLAAFLVTMGGAAHPALSADYEDLVAQARQGKIDHAALRLAYADSKSYDAYNSDLMSLHGPLQKAFAEGDCENAIRQGEAILEKNYVYIDAHMVLSACHRRLGQAAQADHHGTTARGLIQAITATGDGKTAETAFVVISVGEEYIILMTRGLKKVRQALVSKDGHSYDLMTVENRSGGTEQVYFNVDRVLRWSTERFTPKK